MKQDKKQINQNLLLSSIKTLRNLNIDARHGLPEELFLLISSLTPIPNVDLLITDSQNRVLLSWRDDPYAGKGWHIPGGCVRFGETMLERVHKTAVHELGCDVMVDPTPIGIQDAILPPRYQLEYPNDRGHHISILFHCSLPNNYRVNNRGKTSMDAGYLRWFEKFPSNLLPVHLGYGKILDPWKK